MTYDHWKTTEPDSGYDPPEPNIEEEYAGAIEKYERALADLRRTALQIKAERDKFEAALAKIAGWKAYTAPTWFQSDAPLTDYESGANDMLETLRRIAEEGLS